MLGLQRWDFPEGQLQERISQTFSRLPRAAKLQLLRDAVNREFAASYELGFAAAVTIGSAVEIAMDVEWAAEANLPVLTGYVWGLVQNGTSEAFDAFLDGPASQDMDVRTRVALAVRGPVSQAALDRVSKELRSLLPADGARLLFCWHRNFEDERLKSTLTDWIERIKTQDDYNALIDFVSLVLHGRQLPVPADIADAVAVLVDMRKTFRVLGSEGWDWAQLALLVLQGNEVGVATLLFDLIDSGGANLHSGDEDAGVLRKCIERAPQSIWPELTGRISSGSWRIQMTARGWMVEAFPSELVTAWVGNNVDRARLVASIASVGDEEPTAVARFLLVGFGNDEPVASSLAGDFVSGT